MATSTQAAPPANPWKSTFQSHLSSASSPEFVFSSNAHISNSQTVPRARYCIFRSFWAELPENERNPAPRNPRAFESDLLTFTTDVRMHKAGEIAGTHADRDAEAQLLDTDGGAPCEAVFWFADKKIQWRIRGVAFVVGPKVDGGAAAAERVKAELAARMKVVDEHAQDQWSWEKEVTAQFGNLSPGMRGSFAARPPGQPVAQPLDNPAQYIEQGGKVEDIHHATARANFRVVVIRPDDVEWTDLSDPSVSRRNVWTLQGKEEGGEWRFTECWP